MPPKKQKRDTHEYQIVKSSSVCDHCKTEYPWSSDTAMRGYAGSYICDHCDENYFDPEIREGKKNE